MSKFHSDEEMAKLREKYNVVDRDDGSFTLSCKKCSGPIMGARVAHPVWIEGMGCAGTGECRYEQVPYCPNCEEKPNFHGTPVTEAY
jgi:hypothetical protein